jgi:hypothetical protein
LPAQAAIKFWGTETQLNFPAEEYASELEEINNLTTEELVAQLRRMSAGFSRGGECIMRRAYSPPPQFPTGTVATNPTQTQLAKECCTTAEIGTRSVSLSWRDTASPARPLGGTYRPRTR